VPLGDPMPSGALPGSSARPVPGDLPSVVASVNGEEIGRADFENALKALEASAGGPVPVNQRDQIYRRVLDELIAYRLLLQESRTRKIQVNDTEVDERFQSLTGRAGSEEALKGMLARQNLTLEQARAEMKNQLIVSRLLDTQLASATAVKESDISAFYKENPSEFQVPAQVRASHILVSASQTDDAATKNAAREKAAGILKRARAGADFAALAKEFSQDPVSAANGGDLGFFKQGDMVGPFNDTAFALAPGTISDLVETDFGFHIIKVLEKQAARAVPLQEARASIEQYLQNRGRQEQMQQFVQSLRSKGKIDVFI
jgi:peptidyl-prolyl cis-trans isomerase C